MNGDSAQVAQRGPLSIIWSPSWPPLSDWLRSSVIAVVIGLGFGLNAQVWPWHMLTLMPRTAFWLFLSLLTALQWTLVAALLPDIGKPGWAQKIARPLAVLITLAPICGIEYAAATKAIGLLQGVPFADMSISLAEYFLGWGVVLTLPAALIVNARATPLDSMLPSRVGCSDGPPSGDADIQEKLPVSLRGSIIALKAEDHYVRVFTNKGDTLVLMRFADAVSRLEHGLQVHRSYWVRENAVATLVRKDKRHELCLTNGLFVPVSRAYERAVRALVERGAA